LKKSQVIAMVVPPRDLVLNWDHVLLFPPAGPTFRRTNEHLLESHADACSVPCSDWTTSAVDSTCRGLTLFSSFGGTEELFFYILLSLVLHKTI
jgi:hypothetical protein